MKTQRKFPLTREQRYQIAALLAAGHNQSEIAHIIGKHKSVISRELKRNRTPRGHYNPATAHTYTLERRERPFQRRRLTPDILARILHDLCSEQWSPDQIVGAARREGRPMVSHETIYKLIRADRAAGGSLYHHTRHRLKHRRRPAPELRTVIKNKRSIETRPDIINTRSRFGDLEIDTIVGRNNRGAILTIIERQTGFLFMEKLPRGKNADALAASVVRLLLPYKHHIHSITADNGTEFARHEHIASRLGIDFYFCHPYSSWERGQNENTNGLIRQYIPKGTDFSVYTPDYIATVRRKLNRRPRKNLQYLSPFQKFSTSLHPRPVASVS